MVTASPGEAHLTTADTEGRATLDTDLDTANGTAEITLTLQTGSGFGEWAVWFRMTDASNFFAAGYYYDGADWIMYLSKFVAGAFTGLDEVNLGSSTPSAGEVLTVTWDGTSIDVSRSGGSETISATDSSHPTAKGVAIFSYYFSGTAPDITNFEASDTPHALNASDIESSSEVSSPAIGQTHALSAGDVESASELSSPALGQVHALSASDIESSTEVSSPALAEVTPLFAEDIESASEVSSPSLGQVHALSASDVESTSEVTSPSIGQIHALTGADIESASELSEPTVGLGTNLTAANIEAASEVSSPSLGQIHVLLASDIEALSYVSSPKLTGPTSDISQDRIYHVLTSLRTWHENREIRRHIEPKRKR